MNRHHYTLIARTIATSRTKEDGIETLVLRLADVLAATQPNFDRDRFLVGCFERLSDHACGGPDAE